MMPGPDNRGRVVPLLLALSLALAGCGGDEQTGTVPGESGQPADEPRRGGTLVLGSISGVDNWNPYLAQQSFSYDVLRRIYLGLAQQLGDSRDHPPSFEPQLAESWEFSDDGLALTFHLRRAVWSDGRPLTAADVRFTWQAQVSDEVAWTGRSSKEQVRDVEIVDDRTVRFHFDSAYAYYRLADAVDGPILPAHVFGAVPFGDWRTHDWSEARVGSGPFLLQDQRPEQEITLERNPRYHDPELPYVDAVVVRIVPDSGNLLSQLVSGEIDYMELAFPREAQRIRVDDAITITPFDQPKYDFIGWNGSRAPLDDPEVRRALTLAIDREAIVEDLLYGYGRVSAGPVLSFWWAANRALTPWPHDPREALRILTSKGYRPGDDGVLARGGQPLRVELITNAGNPLRESALIKAQEQLRQVGVVAEVQTLNLRAVRQKVVSGDYDGWLGGWVFTGKVDPKPLFGSRFRPPQGMNFVAFGSPRVDALLADLEATGDWKEVKRVLDLIQVEIHRDQPYTSLYEAQRLAVYRHRVHGVQVDLPFDPLARLHRYWLQG